MNILYLGSTGGNSFQRAQALERLGHGVDCVDPSLSTLGRALLRKLYYETGGLLSKGKYARATLEEIPKKAFDLVWVDAGRYVGPELVRTLRERYGPVVNFNCDNPFVYRDRLSWALYRKTVPEYDLVVLNRLSNLAPAQKVGAKKVIIDWRACDEVAHRPRELSPEERTKFGSEVVFVGTGLDDRDAFMAKLVRLGVPLSIWGDHWQKSPHWETLQKAYRGVSTKTDADYSAAILSAQVCVGMVSHGNRDFHTYRSLEVPSMGGVFCGPRTTDHEHLYADGEEAVFWNDAEECADACLRLLKDPALRDRIAAAGHERCLRNGLFNEPFCARVIDAALGRDVPLIPAVPPL